MRDNKLYHAIRYAEEKYVEAGCALQQIQQYLKFKGFEDEEPVVSIATCDEIILVYDGYELSTSEMIECMETKGYIEPIDFRIY